MRSFPRLFLFAGLLFLLAGCVSQADFDAYKLDNDAFKTKVTNWAHEMDDWVQGEATGDVADLGVADWLRDYVKPELCNLIDPSPAWCGAPDTDSPPPPRGPGCDFDTC